MMKLLILATLLGLAMSQVIIRSGGHGGHGGSGWSGNGGWGGWGDHGNFGSHWSGWNGGQQWGANTGWNSDAWANGFSRWYPNTGYSGYYPYTTNRVVYNTGLGGGLGLNRGYTYGLNNVGYNRLAWK